MEASRQSDSRRARLFWAASHAPAREMSEQQPAPGPAIFDDPTYINDTIRREHSPPTCARRVALAMHPCPY